jgi:hypothetical protein
VFIGLNERKLEPILLMKAFTGSILEKSSLYLLIKEKFL